MSARGVTTYLQRQQWKQQQIMANDTLVLGIPKIELHVHIEGTMSAELRWCLSQRNKLPLTMGTDKVPLTTLDKVRDAYTQVRGRIGAGSADASSSFTFFELYYKGFDLLQTEEDFYDLAMGYFQKVSRMNVRYCEPFFDPQGHTRRGIAMEVMMNGFRRAQLDAERDLNVRSQWIMCFLRDMTPESALAQYEASLPYKDMIVGIGLDSDEYDRPPVLFKEIFRRAQEDGFRLTSHCDFNQKDTHEHIRQIVDDIGVERIDHGLNAADQEVLMTKIKSKNIGMTICPCAYIRHTSEEEVFPRIRQLFDTGILISIASDDPAYMEDNWILHNLLMIRDKCKFTDKEIIQLQRNAIDICWAPESLKTLLSSYLDHFVESRG